MRSFGWPELWFLIAAARWTLLLSVYAFAGGGVLGLAVALMRTSPRRVLSLAAAAWINVVQGTPLLMILFGFYYGFDIAGVRVPAMLAAALGMSLYASAFLGEIWQGCLQAVPQAQWEAGAALGLRRWQVQWRIIAPQALRLAVPPTVGFLVQVVKNTSLAAIIGFVEVARAGQMVNNVTFQPFRVFLAVAAIYFVICYPLSKFSRRLERMLHTGHVQVQGT
jgi:polar amino acid transport system permease protein